MTQKVYFLFIWLGCIISGLMVLPFMHTVSIIAGAIPLELTPLIIIIITLQNIIIFGLATFFGMKFAQKIGIHFLLLEPNLNLIKDLFKPGLIVGIGCTLLQVIVDRLLPSDMLTLQKLMTNTNPLYGFLGSFYGAIGEEVHVRLFLLSAIAVIFIKLFKNLNKSAVMWISILISTIIFGLGHIPTYINPSMPATPLLIFRIVGINAISGIAFGYLFWRKSFETVMFAHFINDIGLYVVFPILIQLIAK